MHPIDKAQVRLAAAPEIRNEARVIEGGHAKRRSGHAAAGQEGLDIGEEAFGVCHADATYRTFPIWQEDKSYFPQNRNNPTSSRMDAVRQLILDRVPNLKAMSLSLGRNHAYLHQFVHQNKPRKLPEDVREALAPKIGVNPDDLREKSPKGGTIKPIQSTLNPALNIVAGADLMGEIDLPVHSIVQGGKGALVLENEPFTHTSRPRRLAGKKGAYGVLVRGNSMAREFNENDIAYVDPNLHPKKGDPCVFQGEREDGTWEAILKYLERSPDASETLYYVSQTNPPKKFTIKKAEWQKVHVAVGKESGR